MRSEEMIEMAAVELPTLEKLDALDVSLERLADGDRTAWRLRVKFPAGYRYGAITEWGETLAEVFDRMSKSVSSL